LLRGINNLGSKKVAMAELQEVVTSLGHTDVMTYIQSGNVLFTRRLTDSMTAGRADAAALVFLPEVPAPGLAAWVADAERQVRAKGSRDGAQVLGRTVYLHTPERVPGQRTAPRARQGGRTDLGPSGRNGAQLGDRQQARRALRTLTCRRTFRPLTASRRNH
jgi:hypothetical protein